MSDNNQNFDDQISFVDSVSTHISTDTITDIKSGIFTLFVNLYNNYSIEYGPINGLKLSIEYLNGIIEHFEGVLYKNDNDTND